MIDAHYQHDTVVKRISMAKNFEEVIAVLKQMGVTPSQIIAYRRRSADLLESMPQETVMKIWIKAYKEVLNYV